MSQACANWRGDIGAYVAGALGPVEAARVQRHLRSCAACLADYQDLVPVRDWLSRLDADGKPARHLPGRPPLEPIGTPRYFVRWRWLAGAGAAIAAAVIAVIVAITVRPAPPSFHAFDPATGVHGQAILQAGPTGTQIDLTVTGLSAGQRCTLITVSPASTAVAGTWTADYHGTAQITGTTAIQQSQLTALRIEVSPRRLVLSIPL
jgi:Putative zinc-finger